MMSHLVLINLFLMFSRLKEVREASLTKPSLPGATAPGDIIIGGLFPIHEAVKDNMNLNSISPPQVFNCSGFYTRGLTWALAMIHAVEVANRSPMLSDLNITLGYRINDTCYDVTTALQAVQDFTRSSSACDVPTNSSQVAKPTMAIIGASSSEISIAVARNLNLLLIPQISSSSTAIILSDKSRFPAFMRTVPSDEHQTRAMVKLLKDRKWNWVGIIITDGDYGHSAMESFVTQAAQEGICIAFKQILPDSLADKQKLNTSINQMVNTIVNNSKVKVVVSFAKSAQMKALFKGLYGKVSGRRVWVASDNWSTATNILEEVNLTDIGDVLGFSFKSGNVTSFREFLTDLQFEDEENMNSFLKEFLENPDVGNTTVAVQKLLKNTNPEMVFSIQLAVVVVAKSVAELCGKRQRKNVTEIHPWQMNRELLNRLHKPYVIICICTGVQAIICTLWLILRSPYREKVPDFQFILITCNEGSDVAFGVMLLYIILLALVCFSFAYKGRKLPQKYNEAKFITFGMLIYLMACVIFIPVHVTTSGKYLPAVEMVVILISNYGILSCHFLPKCYIIIFRKEHNTRDAFLKNVYEYASRSSENIRGLSETKPVYIISNPQLVAPENAPNVSVQEEQK